MTETIGTHDAGDRPSSGAGGRGQRRRGRGLRVDRVHTTSGVHPYDEVTWERRDVVMTNWRDGSVNFEQRGVEFPDFWSVNAANIVTTKYFRGAVGTPQRESSLRQLIDRVVRTYRNSGEEHGYFATSDDAEVFEHELAWMLLHQVFSFNSPVWFNVGTTAPQQVSACQPYGALVSTPAGPLPIGQLVAEDAVGTKVYDAHGLTQIVATKSNGTKDVLRIHTKAGQRLDVTGDHLVWRSTGPGSGRFVQAADLRPGDHLEWHQRDYWDETPVESREVAEAEVGFVDVGQAAAPEASTDVPGQQAGPCVRVEISQIDALGEQEVFDIQTESGEYLSENIRVHNCFILSVDDTMESILNWYREEGLIFKGGSGAGLNLSRIRSSKELLSSGGTASGPVSFMRGADASAGTIKSGGATRRAAKMVVLDVDHPDVEEFVETKAREEHKIRALRDAGFDMDLSGADMASVQYQNANNSVRVSDEFMRAVEEERDFGLRGRLTGEVIDTVDAKKLLRSMSQAAWECADPGVQYDDTINDWHTNPETGRITASNPCSEYLSLDNSSCNLASMNLLKFLDANGRFEAERFVKAVELVITAMDISICFADFPTEKIGETTRAYRQLGIGYANLGALLMATAHAYDSEGGRALAAAITSLLTGTAYRRSAELAGVVGPYDGYARNAEAHRRVMRKHAAANDAVRPVGSDGDRIRKLAGKQWQDCVRIGEKNGWRNAQASVLAPTGCLTADTLVTTDRGLVHLGELGDQYGDQWQDLDVLVSTDQGPRRAPRFFVNGEEPTRRITTAGGYRIQGTLAHRVKVVDPASGEWRWKRLADIDAGDVTPIQLGTLVGHTRRVPLPILDQAYYGGDQDVRVPDVMSAELAELVGYFMGDGSLHAKGIRLCVANSDRDVLAHLTVLAKELFDLEPVVRNRQGYTEVTLQSVRLARWWQAAGFAKRSPGSGHVGKGWLPQVPGSVRETNSIEVCAAFLRGLFEADGTVLEGIPSMTTASGTFADEVRTMMLALSLATTTRSTRSGWGDKVNQIRLRNIDHALAYAEIVGFIGARKSKLMVGPDSSQPGKRDRMIHAETADPRLGPALGYLYERVAANEDGGLQPTYDLSVPDNVTYVAAGFVSHNTIGLMMDCDTTGVEPDLALTKFKKLVGGGSMQIVNRTVPRALRSLGYLEEQVEAIVEHITEHGNVVGAPGLRKEHYEVFDCAMGERSISPMGHVRMMAAVQPFISGGISKTVNIPESTSVDEIERIYFEGWRLGLKALAIYRNNCKVGQPLSAAERKAPPADESLVVQAPVRRRLPKQRPSVTTRFSVGGAEGYMTASSYPDDGLGEVFLKLGKQGSTLAGIMDAFSVAISVGLQYGIPLETYIGKFTNMRFEPAGMTDDPDVRIAGSVVDYIFRRLALDFLPYEQRAELGILTAGERAAQVSDSYVIGDQDDDPNPDVEFMRLSAPVEPAEREHSGESGTGQGQRTGNPGQRPAPGVGSSTELIEAQQGTAADAPLCFTCGTKMRPAGSCYVCEGCGSTSGCS